jgi:Ca2+-transporting ATPase
MAHYQQSREAVLEALESSQVDGLTSADAATRLEQYGTNELIEKGGKHPLHIFLDQFKDAMVIILIIAAVVSGILGEVDDVIVILAIVILNAVIGFFQEYRAEQAIAALKKLAVPHVRVRRDGKVQEISARDLVPGEIVLLEAGNLVPADGRIIENINLKVEEAALTGESEPVEKHIEAMQAENLPIGDRKNMVYMGTVVTYGRAEAIITDTGMQTELGNIAELIQGVEEEQTPLQKRLGGLGQILAYAAFGIIALVVGLGLLRGEDIRDLLLTGLSMAVAAVPEGLPAVVTITLALGSQRLLKRNALIRKLPAVETLGSVTVICSDKTGTLTQNRMTVTVLDVGGHKEQLETLIDRKGVVFNADLDPDLPGQDRALSLLVKAGALCNDAEVEFTDEGETRAFGDPTEAALVVAAAQMGYEKKALVKDWPRVAEIPFTSERKRMTTIQRMERTDNAELKATLGDQPYIALSKGAVDSLLTVCSTVFVNNTVVSLDEDNLRERILKANADMAQQGQRVLGVAYRLLDSPEITAEEDIEADEVFLGLVAMIDPPRAEVKVAVEVAKGAGIHPVMITGDHPLTALYIAQDLDIAHNDKFLTGYDLVDMPLEDLKDQVKDVSVYARVSPEHKLNIVEAFQDQGEVVAMTGDGVNDAPALKRADIGIAMGITGTDVSKEAADMVLLDDNFATIVAAVEEGRVIFDNIRKFIKYTLSSNTGELIVMLAAPFLGMPLPLVPIQILWINLVTDGLPGLALAVEKGEPGTMERTPYQPNESIFSRGMGAQLLWIGLLMGIVSLGVGFAYWMIDPNGPWQTMVFTTLTLAQMGNALALRSNTESFFKFGPLENRTMIVAVTLTFVLQMILLYVPFFQRFFETQALSATDLAISLVASSVVFVAVETSKWVVRRRAAS